MEDLSADGAQAEQLPDWPASCSGACSSGFSDADSPRPNAPAANGPRPPFPGPAPYQNGTARLPARPQDTFDLSRLQNSLPRPAEGRPVPGAAPLPDDWEAPANLFELSNSLSLEARIQEAGLVLKRAMHYSAPGLFRERHVRRGVSADERPGDPLRTSWTCSRTPCPAPR